IDLYQAMQQSPMVWLEDSVDNRVQRIVRDYVVGLRAEFVAAHGEEPGQTLFAQRLRQSLDNIARRLGHERHRRLAGIMDAALAAQAAGQGVALHREWIAALLAEYYDPMYAYQRTNKAARIVFAGRREEVVAYLRRNARD